MPHLLLVEDDPEMGEAVRFMLESLGHGVTWARNGREALRALSDGSRVEALLTDILMPDMDGLEVLRHLAEGGSPVPVIAMTGQWNTGYHQAARRFGAAHVLFKPFGMAELQEALDVALADLLLEA